MIMKPTKETKVFKRSSRWLVIAVITACSQITFAQENPNIVMLFIDDWAWNGSPVAMDDAMDNSRMPVLQMPNVQQLAREGMKFRNAYASPQCSPSRVCLQTGQGDQLKTTVSDNLNVLNNKQKQLMTINKATLALLSLMFVWLGLE